MKRFILSMLLVLCCFLFAFSCAQATQTAGNVPVSSFRITTPNNPTIAPGESLLLEYQIKPDNATDPSIEWSSSDPAIASVTADGRVQAAHPGKATITGQTKDGSKRTAKVTIYVPSLINGTDSYTIDHFEGITITVPFYGEWENLQVQTKTRSVLGEYKPVENGILFTLLPRVAGSDTITITDKSDAKCKVILNIQVADSAIIPPFGVLVTGAQLSQTNNALTCQMEFTNAMSMDVTEVGYIIDYYNQFNEQTFNVSKANDSLIDYQFKSTILVKAGRSSQVKNRIESFGKDSPVSAVRIAVYYYRLADGGKVRIPDSQLYWFDSKAGADERPAIEFIYSGPGSDVLNKSESFLMGYSHIDVYSYIARKFAHSDMPGLYVTKVSPDSIAEKGGLLPGDLIYGADEFLWADEPAFPDYAKARMADGKTVVYHVVRNGLKKDLEMKREE